MKKQLTKTASPTAELISLTDKLYSEFAVNELEERLETDPLLLVNLFESVQDTRCTCKNDGCTKCRCLNKCDCQSQIVCTEYQQNR